MSDRLALLRGLYGMVDLAPDGAPRARDLAAALLDGGVTVIQLRMKGADARAMLTALEPMQRLAAGRALVIVNDRLDVALVAGAEGAHLGQDDLPIAAARALCPDGFLIGVSTHNEAQAQAALAAGADYLGFGPIYPTTSKVNPDPIVGPLRLAAVCRSVTIPVVAIGGITLDHLGEIARSGAAAAAIIRAINTAPDISGAARKAHAALCL